MEHRKWENLPQEVGHLTQNWGNPPQEVGHLTQEVGEPTTGCGASDTGSGGTHHRKGPERETSDPGTLHFNLQY